MASAKAPHVWILSSYTVIPPWLYLTATDITQYYLVDKLRVSVTLGDTLELEASLLKLLPEDRSLRFSMLSDDYGTKCTFVSAEVRTETGIWEAFLVKDVCP
jgi:hypothetical protein